MYFDTSANVKKPTLTYRAFGKVADMLGLISKIDLVVAVACLVSIVVLTAYGVITRYVLNDPSTWVEELCLALFVWMTFMGSSALMRTDELVRIDLLVHKLPVTIQRIADQFFRPILLIVTVVFIVYLGSKLVPMSQVRFTPALKISYMYIYAAVPISGVFMIYHQVVHLINAIKSLRQE